MITTGIQVTSNTRGILFTMNDYSTSMGFSKFFRDKMTVQAVALRDAWIEYTTIDGKQFAISNVLDPLQPNILKVESVDSVVPTSLSDLYDLLLNVLN